MGSSCFPALLRRHALCGGSAAAHPEAVRVSPVVFPPKALPGVAEVLGSRAVQAAGRRLAVATCPLPEATNITRADTPSWSGGGTGPPPVLLGVPAGLLPRPDVADDVLEVGRRLAVTTGPYRAGLPCPLPEATSVTRTDAPSRSGGAHDLHSLLQPFLLRRVKAEVAADLPKKTELVIYHGMSALQKKYYKAFLMKDLDVFDHDGGSKARLLNILIQLRKCVNHPYLFDGVEPEPFEMGEHLVEASGKLHLLDKILGFLKDCGHRVLLFSQMTRMLDILQDYMEYRDYSYERLDGSVRGEERHLAIKNFSSKDVFVFLLSTKAGGVGMNLTAADTVIFVDSDFNPQNDLQAAARAHRIGQNRPVKIIRLIGRDTVEEIVYRRATSKLKLTNTVIESGQFSLRDSSLSVLEDVQLSEILKFGVDKLLATEESTIQDADLEMILGKSEKGMWASDVSPTVPEAEGCKPEDQTHMYLYEGKDYSKDPSPQDRKAFDQLVELKRALLDATGQGGRALRNNGDVNVQTRRKRILSPEELEERRKKRQEAAAKRAKLLNEKKLKQEEAKLKKKLAWWESCGYISTCLQSEDSEEESVDEESSDVDLSLGLELDEPDLMTIHYVMGDVTHPQASKEDAIIVHCVDLRLGSVLLFPIDEKECRDTGQDQLALIVAQQRDKANNLSGIKLSALEEGLKKIAKVAKRKKASVHLPRIGHATKGFNWYGTERLIRKYLAFRKILTFMYPLLNDMENEKRKVFVTYETDNDDHVHEIIRFVTLLRQNGFDAHIDMFEQNFRSISKIDFMEKFISELQNEYIQNGSRNFRFVPIIFPGAEKCHVPYWLQNTNVYRWPQDMQDILRRLMRVEKYNPPPIGELPTIVSIPI
ncbi:CHD1L protein, partial [Polypterus senegalus]